jgi:hypothetical protein
MRKKCADFEQQCAGGEDLRGGGEAFFEKKWFSSPSKTPPLFPRNVRKRNLFSDY